jgi:hypothetical protein
MSTPFRGSSHCSEYAGAFQFWSKAILLLSKELPEMSDFCEKSDIFGLRE